ANFFVENRKRIYSASQFFLSIGYFILPTFIIFEQPDLGSALVYGFMFLVMLLFSPFPKKYLIYIAVIAGMLVPFGWMMMKDYQRERIVSFIQPHTKQQGTAYNMTQAIIAVGSGEFVGKGLGSGTQSQLSFLPEDHTDFAFSSLVEQFGFIGGMGVIGLYIVLSLMFIKRLVTYYGKRDEDGYFSFLYTLGFFSFMIFQTFVNIGMNMGVLPIAGITLPLISYGGSSLLTWMLGLALLP
ncbi:FtsW/RodA/SpoVE family cell cycle protein, partial [Candidatus Roizmanbacteria bacterium]|nr:FtsW/RodA/SpoVE family cell cycle protein [Candidatus Roizmanbacteria bacterium]